jgi:hypothetical protein
VRVRAPRFLASRTEAAPTLGRVPLRILLLGALFLPASVAADAGGEALPCTEDAALTRAAAELLLSATPVTTTTLTAAVRQAGSDAVGVHALAYTERAQALSWLRKLEQRSDAPLACGIAHAAHGRLLLASARGGHLEPLGDGEPLVRGGLASGFERGELVVEDGAGETQRFAVEASQLQRGVALSDSLPRPIRVQLLARGKLGPRPVAERIASTDVEDGAPATARVAPDAPGGAADSPSLQQALDALRADAGRPPLRSNALLAGAARRHAQQVCESGRVAHELAPGRDPTRRLREAGITARRVGETVARAESSEAALRSFMSSPSHRLTLLERGFTDAGVGQAEDARGKRCVVVLLAEWPRFAGR